MKNIFLKNGISLFGALLLSQASFCSDRPIDPAIDQFINGVQSETTKRKNSASDNRMSKQKKVNPAISKESDSNVDRVDQIMEYLKSEQEDQLKLKELLLEVLPSVLNDFKQQSPSKPFDPELFKILMAAAFKIDPSAPVGKSKTLYAAIVDVACNGGNLDEDKIAILRKQLEKNFSELEGLSYSFRKKRRYDPSFKEFNEYMKYMKGGKNSYQECLFSSEHEFVCKAFSTIFYIICQNIRKDNAKDQIDFKSDPVYQDNEKISRISQMIWDIYQDTFEIEYIGHLLVDLEENLAIDDLLRYKLDGDNELKWDNELFSKYCLPFDLPNIDVNPIIDLVKKKLKSDTDESDIDEEVNPLYENFLTLVILLSKVNPKKLLFGGKTPCCDLLDRFIDTGAISSRNDSFKIVKNSFIETIKLIADKQRSQEDLLKIIVSWLNQLILYEEEGDAYDDDALVEEISENSLTQEDPHKELWKKIYAIKIQCLAEILCVIFRRYFSEYPEDQNCDDMKEYCWLKMDEWQEKCKKWAEQDKENQKNDLENSQTINTSSKEENPYFYYCDGFGDKVDNEEEEAAAFCITIEKSELVSEAGVLEVDNYNGDSNKIEVCYQQTPKVMEEMHQLFNAIRDAIRAPLQGQTPLNGNPQ